MDSSQEQRLSEPSKRTCYGPTVLHALQLHAMLLHASALAATCFSHVAISLLFEASQMSLPNKCANALLSGLFVIHCKQCCYHVAGSLMTLCVRSVAEHGWVLHSKHCAAGGHCQLLVDALLLAFMLCGDTCIMMPIERVLERSTQSGLLIPCH
jgi:hypothetical protein